MKQKEKLIKAIDMLKYLANCAWLPDDTVNSIYDLLEELED